MYVTFLSTVQGDVVTLRSPLRDIDEETPGQRLPDDVHVPGGVQPHPGVVAELHQLPPDLQCELQMSVDEEVLLTPSIGLAARLERSPDVEQGDHVALVSGEFLK